MYVRMFVSAGACIYVWMDVRMYVMHVVRFAERGSTLHVLLFPLRV